MRLRYFFPFVAKGIENSKLMQTSSDFSSRKPIFSIQGNWQERSSFQKDVKNRFCIYTLLAFWISISPICNTTFVGKHLDVFFRLRPFSLLDFHCCPFHCCFFIVGIFIVGIFHCWHFHCCIFIVKFSL